VILLENGNRYRTQESEYNRLFEFFVGIVAFALIFYGAFIVGLAFSLPLVALCWAAANALQFAGMQDELSWDIASYLFIGVGSPVFIWVLARIWVPIYIPLLRDTCFLLCAGSFSFGKAWALVRSVASDAASDWGRLANFLKRSIRALPKMK